MQGKIEIGVIPQDLRQEETIVQIAEALDTLNSAVSNIFGCIDERLSENTRRFFCSEVSRAHIAIHRLAGIKNRAVRLQGKLNHLQNNLSLKAVKLYSAAKYPSNHVYREYPVAIEVSIPHDEKPPVVYKSPVPIEQESKSQGTIGEKAKSGKGNGSVNIQEKLQFYHVRNKEKERNDDSNSRAAAVRPSSVSSFLLNDGKDNQYGKQSSKSSPQANDKMEIEDAPTSILQSWHPTDLESPSNYFYAPTLGEVPLINVPLTLPDLPGIVDDERFVLDLNGQSPIAPSSVVTTPTVNLSLPATQSNSTAKSSPAAQISVEKDPSLPNLSLPSLSSEQLPPPPPPPVGSSTGSQPSPPAPPPPKISATSVLQSPPPPPPPPPPLSEELSLTTKETKTQLVKTSPKQELVDDRSSLMAAIRNAGGIGRAKLKRAVPKEEKVDKWSSASVGGDLMADLHTKLSLRRKGISGTGTGALDRISAMIPPPPKPNESATSERNSAASEQDSQPDTDDWEE